MKKVLSASILGCAMIAVAAFIFINAAEAKDGQSRAYLNNHNLPSTGIALEGYCPVAYHLANKPLRGKAKYASTYQGVTYHLYNADAKAAFDEDPEKYLPAFGGWCAFGMAIGDKFPVDPTNFKIVNGRLMVFLRNSSIDALELWNGGNEADQIGNAENYWEKVQG